MSVLICSFNAEQFIEGTLLSVLKQTYSNLELLVLDNQSSDSTVETIQNLQRHDSRLQLFQTDRNLGPYPGLNYLLERAQGKYVAINDHDDIWHSAKLERQVKTLEQNPSYAGCGSGILNWFERHSQGILRSQAEKATIAWHTSLVYRNQGYRYDVSKKVGTDFYFMHNILCGGGRRIYNYSEPYVLRRIWASQKNLSSTWMKQLGYRELLSLTIPLFDKLALLNRKLVPERVVEWMLFHVFHRHAVVTKKMVYEDELMKEFAVYVR